VADLATHYDAHPPLGEVTVVLEGVAPGAARVDVGALESRARALLADGLSRRDVVTRLTESTGLPRNEVYRLVTDLDA
jgi:hypothetical protein